MNVMDTYKLDGQVVVITGGAGLLGRKHAEAVLEAGGIPALVDIQREALDTARRELGGRYPGGELLSYEADITDRESIEPVKEDLLKTQGHIDALINNAANNPKVEGNSRNMKSSRFEDFPMSLWLEDIEVGLTGAFLCAQVFGGAMASRGQGVVLNISSDLGIIAPDQRIYRKEGLKEEEQSIKPVTYSVVKHGLLGLTKYLASYWAEKGVRVNALCPAGVYNGQDEEFVEKLSRLIPMGRMARVEEYKGTIVYMLSEACSYMTGATVIVDGGRTCW